jgi:hypothetical protein
VEAANGAANRTNAETKGRNPRFLSVMPIVEFTPMSAHALWSDVIGWILGKLAFRVDKRIPEPLNGLIRKID